MWALIEQPTAKRAEVGPIVPRAMRAEIVYRTSINYHVAEEELNPHTAKQKSKMCPVVLQLPDLPLQGVEVTGGEGRDHEERTDDATDGEQDQKWNNTNFQRLIFSRFTETFIILATADKLRRFRGGFDSIPSYTLIILNDILYTILLLTCCGFLNSYYFWNSHTTFCVINVVF